MLLNHFRKGHPPPFTVLVSVLIIAFIPGADAARGETITGELSFSHASLVGQTDGAFDSAAALHVASGRDALLNDDPLVGISLTIEAANAMVRWSQRTWTSAGTAPGSPESAVAQIGPPDERTGHTEYKNATLVMAPGLLKQGANLLFVATQDFQLSARNMSALNVFNSEGQTWTAGPFSNQTQGTAFLTRNFTTEANDPIFQSTEPMELSARGNFTLHMWGPSITVRDDVSQQNYRSGVWYDNATGTQADPRGIVRTEHWQSVTVSLSEASMRLQVSRGSSQWTDVQCALETIGRVSFAEGEGLVRSQTSLYKARDEHVTVDGVVRQRISRLADEPSLWSSLEASQAQTNLPVASTISVAPETGRLTAWTLFLAFAFLILTAGVLVWSRRGILKRDWEAELGRAHEALAHRRSGRARRHARRLLARDQEDSEAWYVYGASLLLDHDAKRVVGEVGPVAKKLNNHPSLCFLVGVANLDLERVDEAGPWLKEAGKEPAFLEEIRHAPLFEELRRNVRVAAWLSEGASPAYA